MKRRDNKPELAELHAHLGASVQPHIMGSIAHEQGIKLPTKNYWEFEDILTLRGVGRLKNVDDLNTNLYHLSELIQSSPLAVEPIVHHTITGAYRNSNIVLHELRFNPAKRNRGGERDLDYIILAAIRGMEKAILEFPQIKVGLILMFDREFDHKLNEIIYEKAKKYQNRGIVGLDLAGPQRRNFKLDSLVDIYKDAKENGFGVTVHTGEERGLKEMKSFVKKVTPHRVGHGFLAWKDKKLMQELADNNIYLEICPSSNMFVGHFKNFREMKKVYTTLYKAGVKLTINTDGPEFYDTNLFKELNILLKNKIFDQKQIDEFIKNGFEASFIK